MYYLSFFLNFLSFLLCFLSYLFSFYSVNALFFDPLFRAWQGPFYSACRGQCFITLPLNRLCLVWAYLPTTTVFVCMSHPCQVKAGLFHSSVHRSTLTCHGINAFSLFPSRHAPNGSPLNLASFGWSIIPAGRTSQKSLGRSCKIGLFPSPHHQTIPPLPLTSGP